MEIIISIVCAYLVTGWMSVSQQMSQPPMDRPMWATNPSAKTFLTMVAMWPASQVIYNIQSTGQVGRSIAYGILSAAIQLGWLSAYIWFVYTLLGSYIDSFILHIAATTIVSIVGGFIVSPIATILSLPITLIFGFFIDLVFPLKSNHDQNNQT